LNRARRETGQQQWEDAAMLSWLGELIQYMSARKKWWLAPILIIMLIFGALVVLSQGSAVAPFIYTVF
jgi:hypothetical protein